MDDAVIADLKQFIAATVSQNTADIRGDVALLKQDVAHLDDRIARLETKVDVLSQSVAEALDMSNEATQTQLDEHDRRLIRLEHKSA
jgi:uncharacterized protein involved in exopolysaccharide biosynthesis